MKPLIQKFIHLSAIFLMSAAVLPALAASTVIDVLVVYTKGAANIYGGDPTTRINQIFQVTNQIYADSGVDLEIRVAKTMQVDYTDDNNAETALNNITFNQHAAFSGVAAAREQAKADMVILYRPYMNSHGSCGVAWVGGSNGAMSAGHKAYMFAHVAINSCGDFVTAHELGHNMGLKHSRKQDGTGGVFHYALGHGVANSFATVMAYQNEFNVDYWTGKVYKFSNPDISTCKNQPCGVDRNNTATGADARYALNITAPQIANFYAGAPATVSSSKASSSKASSVAVTSSSKSSSSSSKPSVSSSKSSVKSSIKSSNAASSVSNVNLTTLAAKVEAARLIHEKAVAAVNANTLAITTKIAAEKTAKTDLSTATKTLTAATQKYEQAVAKYNTQVAKAKAMVPQMNAALVEYNNATNASTKAARLTLYNNLVTKYNGLVELANTALKDSLAAQQQVVSATVAAAAATAKYNAAVAATIAEKGKTAGLTAAVTTALAAYKDLQAQYTAAQKAALK